MRQALTRHPSTPCAALSSITVEVARMGALLSLKYVATGDPAALRLPEPRTSARADGLWKHTCFEAFVRPGLPEAYAEFNLSPSRQWSAYRFSAYRRDMSNIGGVAPPSIVVETNVEAVVLNAVIETGLAASGDWRVGLSAVIEASDGEISYWALAHPPGKPDFHHANCFALELPETGSP